MTTIDSVVYPTYRFGMVQEEIYRGGYPKQRNIPFLKRLDLKTIISLTPNPVDIVDLLNNEGSGNHNNRDSVINKLDLKLNTIENKNNNIDPISNNGNESQIQYIHIKTDKPKEDNIPISFSKINQILLLLIDTNNYPIYIHCLDGSIVTSLVILCFRKLQCWPLQASLAEAGRFLKDDNLTNEESLFIEKYPGDFGNYN
ncbi:tyrosine phosphatase family-domain-containing protein [Globomyces pollinis-pini]|nr:tyrosine phosphatase family-domain-containing protein [Globomyces pollinis-pini]